jgi:hypothetical protein
MSTDMNEIVDPARPAYPQASGAPVVAIVEISRRRRRFVWGVSLTIGVVVCMIVGGFSFACWVNTGPTALWGIMTSVLGLGSAMMLVAMMSRGNLDNPWRVLSPAEGAKMNALCKETSGGAQYRAAVLAQGRPFLTMDLKNLLTHRRACDTWKELDGQRAACRELYGAEG